MTRLVDAASRLLEPAERDVVLGDFVESGESGARALGGVLGLVVRRQAALWKDWRPRMVLVGLIVPLAMLLSIVSKATAGESATYIWLYANNWDWALLRYAEFWYEVVASIAFVFFSCLTLICWSWTAGFVLGSVSRRVVQVYGVLFCLMLVVGGLFGAPIYFAYLLDFINRPLSPDEHDPVFALTFYRVLLPLIVQVALVAVPSLWGMRQGARAGGFSPLIRILIWTAAIATLLLLLIQEPGLIFFLKALWLQRIWQSWHVRLLHFLVYWPVVYFIASGIWHRWHIKESTT
jgi:hypothetical protein